MYKVESTNRSFSVSKTHPNLNLQINFLKEKHLFKILNTRNVILGPEIWLQTFLSENCQTKANYFKYKVRYKYLQVQIISFEIVKLFLKPDIACTFVRNVGSQDQESWRNIQPRGVARIFFRGGNHLADQDVLWKLKI